MVHHGRGGRTPLARFAVRAGLAQGATGFGAGNPGCAGATLG